MASEFLVSYGPLMIYDYLQSKIVTPSIAMLIDQQVFHHISQMNHCSHYSSLQTQSGLSYQGLDIANVASSKPPHMH